MVGGPSKRSRLIGSGHDSDPYIEEMTGDLNGLGELGESVYGENADIRLLFGDGSIGDFNAIIMVERN